MQYRIPFQLRNKENAVIVHYSKMENAWEAGFQVLKVPFDAEQCVGYPMIHAYFEELNLKGYERYCGWIQLMRKDACRMENGREIVTTSYEIDSPDFLRPYFCIGYPAELFDAPCHNLGDCERLTWTAYTYLVDPPSRMNDDQLSFLAGFSWGYTEGKAGVECVADFRLLNRENWEEHRKYWL